MGQFRATIAGVGNHGCQREHGNGEHVVGCERPGCVDCIIRECVRRLKRAGVSFEGTVTMDDVEVPNGATLEHWPATPATTVVDDLITGKRTGSF